MNLLNLSLKNVQKRFFSYITYFLSTTFAVAVFYIFCSIYCNPCFSRYSTGISKMGIIFKASAGAVLVFSSIFIFYSNSLFIKTRKKELAIYSILGMKKREIVQILFVETFAVGLGSIVCGILIGALCAKLFSLLLLKLMLAGAKGSSITFSFTLKPAILTVFLFIGLFVLNALGTYRMIYRSKLIDLLSAQKQGEHAPKFSTVAALLSIVLIGASYIIFLNLSGDDGAIKVLKPAFAACSLLVIGTYLLFRNFVIYLVSKLKSNLSHYYKPQNLLSISQLVYRIKSNANILCLISLVSSLTIVVMSAAICIYITVYVSLPIYAPFSYLTVDLDTPTINKMVNLAKNDTDIRLESVTPFTVTTSTASCDGYLVDTNNKFGPTTTKIGEPFKIDILKFSDYQTIIKNTHAIFSNGNKGAVKVSSIADSECLFLDGNYDSTYSHNLPGSNVLVTSNNNPIPFKIAASSLHKYMGADRARTTIVISDSAYDQYFAEDLSLQRQQFTGLNFDEPLNSSNLVNSLNEIVPEDHRDISLVEIHSLLFSIYGAMIFIGVFLGILFLIAAGSIIFYKQLMEARDETSRYDTLRKLGMTRKEILASIRKQIGMVFLIPLSCAVIHSIIGLITFEHMVYTITTDSHVLMYSLIVLLIYLVIYLFFYILSINGYMRTVWVKKDQY